jgi:myo-inositol catabolism protein IolC
MQNDRVHMLAADHRWQWEEWCARESVPVSRVTEVKGLIFEAFVQARERSAHVRQFGSLLLDMVYAAPYVERARQEGIPVATPAEKAGVFPLQWGFEPFHAGLRGTMAKVLIRHRPEQPIADQEAQIDKMLALQAWCREQKMPLLVEIIVMRADEPEEEFEATGRPAIIAAAIRHAYARGLAPDLWKLEGTANLEAARIVDAAIRERPGCAQIILGKGADAKTIDRWFDTATACPSAIGFAIGRSVFWTAGISYLRGSMGGEPAAESMAETYLRLVEAWERRAP